MHESRTAEAMLEGVEGDAVIADKAYDSNAIRDTVKAAGMKAVIPSNRSRKKRIRHDKCSTAAQPHQRCFNKLKHFDASPPAIPPPHSSLPLPRRSSFAAEVNSPIAQG